MAKHAFQKRHFEEIADKLRETKPREAPGMPMAIQWQRIVDAFADAGTQWNPAFKRELFVARATGEVER